MTAGLVMEAGFLLLAFAGDLRQHLPLLFAVYAGQFALMIWVWSHKTITPGRLWLFAILFRLTLLPTFPSLSDDIFRYAWEGRIQRAGASPYALAPSAPQLVIMRDDVYPHINHKDVPTVYPPATQAVFRAGSYISDVLQQGFHGSTLAASIYSQKALFVLLDVLCLWAICELLSRRRQPARNAILYAWNPLVILEFAGSGHNDSLGIFFLMAGLLYWEEGRTVRSALALAASFLSKYLSAILFPYFAWKRRWRECAVWASISLIGFLPFYFKSSLFLGAGHYAGQWQFNGSLFLLLALVAPNVAWAKWGAAILAAVFAIAVGKKEEDLARAAFLMVAVLLLLAPTVHPWYFVWLIPLLCLFPNPAFLAWNLTIVLSYSVWARYLSSRVWDLDPAVQWLEYLPVYGLLAWSRVRRGDSPPNDKMNILRTLGAA